MALQLGIGGGGKDRVYMNDSATRAEGGKERMYMNDSATSEKGGK